MRKFLGMVAAAALVVAVAAPAWADQAPTSRDIQSAVDSYLATAEQDASLVGGPGSAGYDAGFWIRGGDFSLRINLTLQARFEYIDYDEQDEFQPGGDLSGFSLPRTTVKFSGTAPCSIRYYVELQFGHHGREFTDELGGGRTLQRSNLGVAADQSWNFDYGREAWIEWGMSDAFNFRMGQIMLPLTRQLMVAPELQQFVDVSLASAWTGVLLPGFTDRNRDHGAMVHGVFGCNGEFSYMFAVTNGDGGDSIRNILDDRTSDNLAFSGRLNWAFLQPIGYQEGALNQSTCEWYGEVGAWAFYYADRVDMPHTAIFDALAIGGDLALGYGSFSFTSAFTWMDFTDSDFGGDTTVTTALAQLGYLIPGTAWEVAARWSWVNIDPDTGTETETHEIAGAINYYLNGHGNKLQLDVSYLMPDDQGGPALHVYGGIGRQSISDDALLVRFQWQLAL